MNNIVEGEMMGNLCLIIFFVSACAVGKVYGETCTDDNGNRLDCSNGCCDDGCCVEIPLIAYIVGGVMVVLFIAGIIVCCCIWAKKRSSSGTGRIQPIHNSNVVHVNSSPYGHPPSYQPPAYRDPPAYSNYNAYPQGSGFGYNDPVYPPGMVSSGQTPSVFKQNN